MYMLLSFQHIWTPDVIIHDLVKFNKPEILNQVINRWGGGGVFFLKFYESQKNKQKGRLSIHIFQLA